MNQKQCKRCGKMVNVEGVHTCCSPSADSLDTLDSLVRLQHITQELNCCLCIYCIRPDHGGDVDCKCRKHPEFNGLINAFTYCADLQTQSNAEGQHHE